MPQRDVEWWLQRARQAAGAIGRRELVIELDRIPLRFHRLSLKRVANWLLAEAGAVLKPTVPWAYPTHLQVEPTNRCNLRCALCPVTEGMDRPTGSMDFRLFQKVVDQIGDTLLVILFWDWGEPFLNRDVYRMVRYARIRGIRTVSSTNGHAFAQGGHARRVVESGLDVLIFAIDGLSPETYQRFRHGGQLDTAVAGLRRVIEAREAVGATHPQVHLRLLATADNEHEVPNLESYARALGADACSLKTLHTHEEIYGPAGTELYQPRAPRYHRFRVSPNTGEKVRARPNPCKAPWNLSALHWDGSVCPCTFDPDQHHVLGDLTYESFAKVWFGERYRAWRRQLREDYRQLAPCVDCTNAYVGGSVGEETIAEIHFFDRAGQRQT